MADLQTLTPAHLHNALAMVTLAYGVALADKEREIGLLKAQLESSRSLHALTHQRMTEAETKLANLRDRLEAEGVRGDLR